MLDNKPLSILGYKRGLEPCIDTSGGYIKGAGMKMMADTVEAVFGAIFLDAGIEAVEKSMEAFGLFEHKLLTPVEIKSGGS